MGSSWRWIAVVVQALMGGLVVWRLWEVHRVRHRSDTRLTRPEGRVGDFGQQVACLEARLGDGVDRQHLHG